MTVAVPDLSALAARLPTPDDLTDADTPIALHVVTGADAALAAAGRHGDAYTNWAKVNGFEGKPGQVLLLPDGHGAILAAFVGAQAGDDGHLAPGFELGKLPGVLPEGVYRLETRIDGLDTALTGFLLGGYAFARFKGSKRGPVRLVVTDSPERQAALTQARGVIFARDLINTPANLLGPAAIEASARGLAETFDAPISVIEGEALLDPDNPFPMIHTVGLAAHEAPRLIDFSWAGAEDGPRITLVGKGVAFDSGGLNIKPGNAMALMKKDMGGAAAVLGLALMIMQAGLPVRLRVLVPAVENAISAGAFRPGDVLTSRKGLTVDIGNTDAEGRLILADALALADEEAPDLLIDMATLTGAARVALGPDLLPFFTGDDALASALAEAGATQDDPVWRLPLWERYDSAIAGKVGDISNTGSMPFAGAITAALFLRRFVDKAKSWVHFDIFGWTPSARPGRPEGGEAQGIRALFTLLKDRYPPAD